LFVGFGCCEVNVRWYGEEVGDMVIQVKTLVGSIGGRLGKLAQVGESVVV